jgi:hypothetical protein
MYMVIRHYHDIDPAYASQSIERNRTTLVPLLSQQPGFVSYYTIEGEDGSVVSIGVYESKEEAERSNQIAADWTKQNSSQYVRKPPKITQGEVLVYRDKGQGT